MPIPSLPNNLPLRVGSAGYVAGSGSLTLGVGQGARLAARLAAMGLPPVSPTAPVQFSITKRGWAYSPAADYDATTYYQATGLTGDVLSGLTAVEGTTDQAYAYGDVVDFFLTGKIVADLAAQAASGIGPDGDGSGLKITTDGTTGDGTAAQRFGAVKYLKADFGAVGDGSHDDTAALQAALDWFSNPDNPIVDDRYRTGRLVIEPGEYPIKETVTYRGTYGNGLAIEGMASTTGPEGAVIRYDGTAGAAGVSVLELSGACDVTLAGFALDARLAQFGLFAHYDAERSVGVTNLMVYRVNVLGVDPPADSPTRSACISLGELYDGTLSSSQCDHVKIIGCALVGHRRCVATGTGNVANVLIAWCALLRAEYLVERYTGGNFAVQDCAGGLAAAADFKSLFGSLNVKRWYSEGSYRLHVGQGPSGNVAPVVFEDVQFFSGNGAGDMIAVNHQGQLELRRCIFRNTTAAGAVWAIGAQPWDGNAASVTVEHCTFVGAAADWTGASGTVHVLQDGSGNSIIDPEGVYPGFAAVVRAWGNVGGDGGSLVRLPNHGPGFEAGNPALRLDELLPTLTPGADALFKSLTLGQDSTGSHTLEVFGTADDATLYGKAIMVLRAAQTNALEFGLLAGEPFGGWIQAGGSGAYSLILQPRGGPVGLFGIPPRAAGKVLYIANGAVPADPPSGGGYLLCEGGALKFIGGSGTPTDLAPA